MRLLALLCLVSAPGQSWTDNLALPVFRSTAVQAQAAIKRAHSLVCLQNLKNLGLACRFYANDNGDRLPVRWEQIAGTYLADAKYLYCPADAPHPQQTNWATVDFKAISYALNEAAQATQPGSVLASCLVHGNVVYADGRAGEAHPYDARLPYFPPEGALAFPAQYRATGRESSLSFRCLGNLRQLALAVRLYAVDNADRLPARWADCAESLYSPAVLFCPVELWKVIPTNLAQLDYATVSYLLESPGQPDTPTKRIASCLVHGHYADSTGASFTGTNWYPPRVIVGHPLSQTVEPGAPATLRVLTGDPNLGPFQFQWRRVHPIDLAGDPATNDVVLVGATNTSLVLPATQAADEGYYDVIVADADGRKQYSQMAYLRVEPPATILNLPDWREAACRENLHQIALAARLFVVGTRPFAVTPGASPERFEDFPNFLGWPLTLFCPSDIGRTVPLSWETVDFDRTSYVLNTGLPLDAITNVLATCRVHGFQVQADGRAVSSPAPPLVPHLEVVLTTDRAALVLTVRGIPGLEYVLKTSADLAAWTTIATNRLVDGVCAVTNSIPASSVAALYRATLGTLRND